MGRGQPNEDCYACRGTGKVIGWGRQDGMICPCLGYDEFVRRRSRCAEPQTTDRATPKMDFAIRSHQELRATVYKRDDFTCQSCGLRVEPRNGTGSYTGRYTVSAEGTYLTLDHIEPRFRGGEHTVENLQTMCQPCNASKGVK